MCYRYYASKEEIYDAALDKYASNIAAQNIKRTKLDGLTLKEQILQMSGQMKEYVCAEREQTELYALFHKKENYRMHNELFLRVSEKIVPFFVKALEDAIQRGEISLAEPKASAYFFVYGQMGLLMSKDYSEEEKTQKIQKCLLEMLGLE